MRKARDKVASSYILVVKYNVRKPYVLARYIEFSDTSVFCWIPLEFVVLPFLGKVRLY